MVAPIAAALSVPSVPAAAKLARVAPSPLPYDHREQWYAAGFASDLPRGVGDAPAAFSVFDEPIALWHDGSQLRAVADRCPHRLAALSQGGVEPDGTLRCFYHGWAFDGAGACAAMPQLAKGLPIPKSACVRPYEVRVRESIAWVWLGDEVPSKEPPASVDDLDAHSKDFDVYDFVVELPYDHSFLVENLADPAHIPISHDRTPGGGKRENAEAYVMELDEASISSEGFAGRFRPESKPDSWQDVKFEAPGIVRYRLRRESDGFVFGGALHCMPRGAGRSRLLFRTYYSSKGGIPKWARLLLRLKPLWAKHLNSCKILEQDVALITSQEDHLQREGTTLADSKLLTLQSSDTFVLAYRRWLDRVGHGMPWHVGWETSRPPPSTSNQISHISHPGHRSRISRFDRHVLLSRESTRALRRAKSIKVAARAVFVGLAAAAFAAPPLPRRLRLLASAATVMAAATSAAAAKVESAFHDNYRRHPEP